MEVISLVAAAVLSLVAYSAVRLRVKSAGPFLPDAFVIGLSLYALGSLCILFGEETQAASVIVEIAFFALISGIAGATIFSAAFRRYYRGIKFAQYHRDHTAGPVERAAITGGLMISVAVCLLFVYAVLSSSIISALLSVASIVTDSALLDVRKAITSGEEGYFAPGYVKQFRDVLIPVLLLAMMVVGRDFYRKPLFWAALLSAFAGMALSGQRLVFIIMFLSLIIGWAYLPALHPNESRRQLRAGPVWIFVIGAVLTYGLLTFLLGRVEETTTPFNAAVSVVQNIWDRAVVAVPRENAITSDIWLSAGPTAGGSWLSDLSGVLPGSTEGLSNILHSATGGSLQGNSPLGLPADVWLAWGWWGVVIVPLMYGILLGLLDFSLLTNRSPILFGLKIYLFIVVPICYSPFLFLLYGGAVAIVLMVLLKWIWIAGSGMQRSNTDGGQLARRGLRQ